MTRKTMDLRCPKCYKPAGITRTMRGSLDTATGRQPVCRLAECSECKHTFLRYEDTLAADNRLDIAHLRPANGKVTVIDGTTTQPDAAVTQEVTPHNHTTIQRAVALKEEWLDIHAEGSCGGLGVCPICNAEG